MKKKLLTAIPTIIIWFRYLLSSWCRHQFHSPKDTRIRRVSLSMRRWLLSVPCTYEYMLASAKLSHANHKTQGSCAFKYLMSFIKRHFTSRPLFYVFLYCLLLVSISCCLRYRQSRSGCCGVCGNEKTYVHVLVSEHHKR